MFAVYRFKTVDPDQLGWGYIDALNVDQALAEIQSEGPHRTVTEIQEIEGSREEDAPTAIDY